MWKIDSGLGAWSRNLKKPQPTSSSKRSKHRRKKELRADLRSASPPNEEKFSPAMIFSQDGEDNSEFYHRHPEGFTIKVGTFDHKHWIAWVEGHERLTASDSNPQSALASLFSLPSWYYDKDSMQWTSAQKEHRKIHIILRWKKNGKVVPHSRTLPKKGLCPTLRPRQGKEFFNSVTTKKITTPKPKYRTVTNPHNAKHERTTNEMLGSYSDDIGRL